MSCKQVQVTENARQRVMDALGRTKLRPEKLAALSGNPHFERLAQGIVQGTLETAPQDLVNELIVFLDALPDAPNKTGHYPQAAAGKIGVTEAMRAELCNEIERTRPDIKMLVNSHATLSAIKVSRWKTGRSQSADPGEWAWLMETLKNR